MHGSGEVASASLCTASQPPGVQCLFTYPWSHLPAPPIFQAGAQAEGSPLCRFRAAVSSPLLLPLFRLLNGFSVPPQTRSCSAPLFLYPPQRRPSSLFPCGTFLSSFLCLPSPITAESFLALPSVAESAPPGSQAPGLLPQP